MFSELWEALGPEYGLLVVVLMIGNTVLAGTVAAVFLQNRSLTKQLIDNSKESTTVLTKLEIVLSTGFSQLQVGVADIKAMLLNNKQSG